MRESTIHQKASSSFCSARTSAQGPLYPTLRANPFPEVTDLFCRLPLPTLFYRPEAANLGDLMRLWVRPGVWISLSFGFSRTVESAPNTSEDKVLYPPIISISSTHQYAPTESVVLYILWEQHTLFCTSCIRMRWCWVLAFHSLLRNVCYSREFKGVVCLWRLVGRFRASIQNRGSVANRNVTLLLYCSLVHQFSCIVSWEQKQLCIRTFRDYLMYPQRPVMTHIYICMSKSSVICGWMRIWSSWRKLWQRKFPPSSVLDGNVHCLMCILRSSAWWHHFERDHHVIWKRFEDVWYLCFVHGAVCRIWQGFAHLTCASNPSNLSNTNLSLLNTSL